ncbi:hypothetical protein VNI00_016417 [Paramarasmius palmivorus]|uniref:BED-type domain-containing protein n=1 Tax=Paramarasmius palmivorus TaxID=297713 RepID=A0AAW0BDY5_9AGAR
MSNFWEPVSGDRSRTKCTICASCANNESDGIIKKTSKSSHLKTAMHLKALQACQTLSPGGSLPSRSNLRATIIPEVHPAPPNAETHIAVMEDLDEILKEPGSDHEPISDTAEGGVFSNIILDEHEGTYFDTILGQPVVLTAGEDPNVSRLRNHDVLTHQMDNIGFLSTSSVFDVESLEDTDNHSNPVMDQLNMAIENLDMGSDDEREDMEVESHAHDAEEWKPHGSKTVTRCTLPTLRQLMKETEGLTSYNKAMISSAAAKQTEVTYVRNE